METTAWRTFCCKLASDEAEERRRPSKCNEAGNRLGADSLADEEEEEEAEEATEVADREDRWEEAAIAMVVKQELQRQGAKLG